MAQNKKDKYEKELLEIIKAKKIVFFDHCFAFTSFSRATAYNHDLEKLDTIKNALHQNRVKAKNYLINKWIGSDNATLQISAYRLMSDTEEHQKLNQSYIDHTSKGEKINQLTPEQVREKAKKLREDY
jgi:hypothetical protein